MIIFIILAFVVLADGYSVYSGPVAYADGNMLVRMCEQNGISFNTVQRNFISIQFVKMGATQTKEEHTSNSLIAQTVTNNLDEKLENVVCIFIAILDAAINFVQCAENNFGIRMFETDIKNAQDTGDYSTVAKKYCAKTPQLKACYNVFIDAIYPCFGDKQAYVRVGKNVSYELLNYMCYNDGNAIVSFINEGGQQCFESKIQDLLACNGMFNELLKSSMFPDQTTAQPSALSQSNYQDGQQLMIMYDDFINCTSQVVESCHKRQLNRIFKSITTIVHNAISSAVHDSAINSTTADVAYIANNTTSFENVNTNSDGQVKSLYNKETDNETVQARKNATKHFTIASGTVSFSLNAEIFV